MPLDRCPQISIRFRRGYIYRRFVDHNLDGARWNMPTVNDRNSYRFCGAVDTRSTISEISPLRYIQSIFGGISSTFGSIGSFFVGIVHLDREKGIDREKYYPKYFRPSFHLVPEVFFCFASNLTVCFGWWRGRNA